jgi:hypothetical protein
MIDISYNRDNNLTRVELNNSSLIKTHLPLKIQFKNIISNEIHYETELQDYWWTEWRGGEFITDVLIYSLDGTLLHEYKWDVVNHGDEIEKMLWFYLKSRQTQGIKSNGLVIGSHDGRNGHWIYPVKHKLTDVTLIDGSDKQFISLIENYKNQYHVETLNTVVTVDGFDVEWYQGGEGYTDTVVPSVINSWLDSSKIKKSYRKSIAINDLMKDKNYDWLHLDVEGLDGDLILALEYKPNLIIYEDENLDIITKTKLDAWFLENSYTTIKHKCNIIAVKNG